MSASRAGSFMLVPVVALLVSARAALAAEGPGWMDAEVDGGPERVAVLSVDGEPGHAVATDLLVVRGHFLLRGPEPALRFRVAHGRILLVRGSGDEVVVSAVASTVRPAPPTAGRAPTEALGRGDADRIDTVHDLDDAALAGLRGLQVFGWSAEIAAQVSRVDPSRAVIAVAGTDRSWSVPALPASTRYLALGAGESETAPPDLAPLARLVKLRALVLGPSATDVTDVSPLRTLHELRFLDVSRRSISNVESLAGLVALRTLDLDGCTGIGGLEFARGIPQLATLDVSLSDVTDLRPVSSLLGLQSLDATASAVRTLPDGRLPALAAMRLVCSQVDAKDVDAFRRAHPACLVAYERRELLLKALIGADRVRIRTGGPGSIDAAAERTIADLSKREDFDAFLDAIRIEEPDVVAGCSCGSAVTFEVFAGTELRAAIGLHQGAALEWSDGEWPGNAPLTAKSSERICAWVAGLGERGPLETLAARRFREAAESSFARRAAILLPKAVAEKIESAESGEARLAALIGCVPDVSDRTLLALRLLGASADAEWNGISDAAQRALDTAPRAVVVSVATKPLDDEARVGVGCWLFPTPGQREDWDGLAALVPSAAERLLADEDPNVRGRAIDGLRQFGKPPAMELLRRVLDRGRPTAVPSTTTAVPTETDLNVQWAAEALVELHDRESASRIRALSVNWPKALRERLEARLGSFDTLPQAK